jgi:hypothetical protein
MKLRFAILIAAIGAIAAPAVASAATIEVPADFTTIQQAVDAAAPGDTVAVNPRQNPYRQNVEVTVSDLTITGVNGRPVVNAFNPMNSITPAFDITANGVSISGFEIHHGGGIECVADNCTFTDLVFRGRNSSDCIGIIGRQGRVTDSDFEGCDSHAVEVNGNRARIEGNSAQLTDSDCYFVDGKRLRFSDNTAVRCEDGEGLEAFTSNSLIEESLVRQTDNAGFRVEGEDNEVTGNSVFDNDSDCYNVADGKGLLFQDNSGEDCEGAELNGNRIRAIGNEFAHVGDGPCLDVNGDRGVLSRNVVGPCWKGIEVSGENPTVTVNTVTRVHTDDGINVSCSDTGGPATVACEEGLVANNVVEQSGDDDEGISVFDDSTDGGFEISDNVSNQGLGDGFQLQVDNALITRNVAMENGSEEEPGFDLIGDGNLIEDNVAIRNGGEGFTLAGDDNEMNRNLAEANGIDGIRVGGLDNVLFGNQAFLNLAEGIQNDGADARIRNSRSSDNEGIDCANDGMILVNSGNECGDGSDFTEPSSGLDR